MRKPDIRKAVEARNATRLERAAQRIYNRDSLVREVAMKTGMTQPAVRQILGALLDTTAELLTMDEVTSWGQIGHFWVTERVGTTPLIPNGEVRRFRIVRFYKDDKLNDALNRGRGELFRKLNPHLKTIRRGLRAVPNA